MLPIRKKNSSRRSFTLVELLVTSMIMALVAMTIYSLLSSGLRIYKKVMMSLPDADIAVFSEKFTVDLRNSNVFSGIAFAGDRQMAEFPTIVRSARLGKRTIGMVSYRYEPLSHVIVRTEKDYAAVTGREEGNVSELLSDVRSAAFSYFIFDEAAKEYFWVDAWSNERPPLAVRIEFERGEREGGNLMTTVSIPAVS